MAEFNPMDHDRPRHRGYDHYAPKLVKARKDYECDRCRARVSKGALYETSRRPVYTSIIGRPAQYETIRRCEGCANARALVRAEELQ